MTVRRVLESKTVEGMHTIGPGATVAEAATALGAHRIGVLVVVERPDGPPVGVLSERDVVRALGASGAEILSRKVADLMTTDVKTCTLDDPAQGVLRRMTVGRFRHMPVLGEDGALIGLVSLGDVVKMRLTEVASERDAMEAMIAGQIA